MPSLRTALRTGRYAPSRGKQRCAPRQPWGWWQLGARGHCHQASDRASVSLFWHLVPRVLRACDRASNAPRWEHPCSLRSILPATGTSDTGKPPHLTLLCFRFAGGSTWICTSGHSKQHPWSTWLNMTTPQKRALILAGSRNAPFPYHSYRILWV